MNKWKYINKIFYLSWKSSIKSEVMSFAKVLERDERSTCYVIESVKGSNNKERKKS